MHTTCIALHEVQRCAIWADPAIRLIVETPPVSVRRFNPGPEAKTMGEHYLAIGSTYHVFWFLR